MWNYEGEPLCKYDICSMKWKRKVVYYTFRIPHIIEREVYVHLPAFLWNINAVPCTDRHDVCPAN